MHASNSGIRIALLLVALLASSAAHTVTVTCGATMQITPEGAGETVAITHDGTNITATGTTTASCTSATVTGIAVSVGTSTNATVEFNNATAITLAGALTVTDIPTVTFINGTLNVGGALSVTGGSRVTTSSAMLNGASITLYATAGGTDSAIEVSGGTLATTANGNISLTGTVGAGGGVGSKGILISDHATVSANGTGGITLNGTHSGTTGDQRYGVQLGNATLTTGGGNISITGQGGGENLGYGVYVSSGVSALTVKPGGTGNLAVTGTGSMASATGRDNRGVQLEAGTFSSTNGTVTVTGTGGAGSGGENGGVNVISTALITNDGTGAANAVTLTGTGNGDDGEAIGIGTGTTLNRVTSMGGPIIINATQTSTDGFAISMTGGIAAGGNASITINSDSFYSSPTGRIDAGTGTVTFQPRTAGTLIALGGNDDRVSAIKTLGFSSDEFSALRGGSVVIGSSTAGNITLSSALTHAVATNLQLVTGGSISSTLTGTDLNLAGGTLSFGSGTTLSATITGTTVDTQYQQLNIAGNVNVNNLTVALTGSLTPATGDAFNLIQATAVSGSFANTSATLNGKAHALSTTATTGVATAVDVPNFVIRRPATCTPAMNAPLQGTTTSILELSLTQAAESVTLQVDATNNLTIVSSGVTYFGTITCPLADITDLIVTDNSGTDTTQLNFAGSNAFSFNGSVTVTGVNTVAITLQPVSASGAITISGASRIVASSSVTGASISLTANQGGTATNNAAILISGGTVTSTGNGAVTLIGTIPLGTDLASGESVGVDVRAGATVTASGTGAVTLNGTNHSSNTTGARPGVKIAGTVTSGGGNVSVTGQGGSGGGHGVSLVDGTITATGTGTVSVTGTGGAAVATDNHGVNADGSITSGGGNVSVTGTGGGTGTSGSNFGVRGARASAISAGGAGTVTVTGVGGLGSVGGANYGIFHTVAGAARITSSGGAITVTATGGEGNIIDALLHTGISSGGNANITVNMDGINLPGVIDAGTGTVRLQPRSAGRLIGLGGTDLSTHLALSAGELNNLRGGQVILGSGTAGNIIISSVAPVDPTPAIPLQLVTGGTISSSLTGNDINLAATGTLTFGAGTRLAAQINGTTVDTQYQRLTVVGNVNVSNLTVTLTGTHTPVFGETFELIRASGTLSGTPAATTATLNGVTLTLSTTATSLNATLATPPTQTVTFDAISSKDFGAAPFSVTANSSQGLPITFASSTPAICTMSGNTVTLVSGAGTCTLTASAPASGSIPAASASQSFIVRGSNAINFPVIADRYLTDGAFLVTATANSSALILFSSSTPSVCAFPGPQFTASGFVYSNRLLVFATGTCTVTASQASDPLYVTATPVTRSFQITLPPPSVCSLANAGDDCDGDGLPNGQDGDPSVKSNDVIGSNTLFVQQLYRDILVREADSTGLGHLVNALNNNLVSRAQLVADLIESAEYTQAVAPISRLYLATFRRLPDTPGLRFWVRTYQSTGNLAAVADQFAGSAEFSVTYGLLNNFDFVGLLYRNVLNRTPDPGGNAFWLAQLSTQSRGSVLLGFSNSTEYAAAQTNTVKAVALYAGVLNRAPTQAEYDAALAALAAGTSLTALAEPLLFTAEYRARFLP